jgi:two-component system cell cycle sensor histidine kinase/response regulator CckA
MTGLRALLSKWMRGRRASAPRLIDRLATARGTAAPATDPAGPPVDDVVELLFEDAPFGAMVVDTTGAIVRANEALRQMVGRDVDLTRGARAELAFAAAVRDAAWEQVAPVLAGRVHVPRGFVTRLEGATADDPGVQSEPMASVSVAPLREADGSLSGVLLRIADITLQKQLEAQLAHSQKLQATGQLAGGIAHDFNNLLTAVLGAAESIALRSDIDAETREDAAHIQSSATRGAALVRQLLAFGRQQTLQPRVLAVNDVIRDISGLLRRLLGTNVQLELDLETPGRTVRVDPTQLDQVLVNLAVNARDAMAEGGVLTLRSGHMTLYRPLARGPETIPPGRYVMIEVRDTGSGIPPEVLPRIFDPFFTTKRERGGSGLGLSTVHGIIRQSDGFLAVESEVDRGTRVRVYLPRWDAQEAVAIPRVPREAPAPAAEPPPPPAQQRRVLLVEDDEPVRRLAERTLSRHGWLVVSAANGEAALALLEERRQPIVAMITDMVMPGMDGATLVREVRALLDQPNLPAILVSGYAAETLRRELESAGTAFLPKPYSLKDLAAKLEEVCTVAASESLGA